MTPSDTDATFPVEVTLVTAEPSERVKPTAIVPFSVTGLLNGVTLCGTTSIKVVLAVVWFRVRFSVNYRVRLLSVCPGS